ncbi:hypothetical protein [Propionicicella superfundia]|uniref:hypothetical protein n=1 Tax=Propionicicella superfundia TaxID=348582 RepID=UPI00040BC097|nr:hypothetical protein [Propionicicella superfundia]
MRTKALVGAAGLAIALALGGCSAPGGAAQTGASSPTQTSAPAESYTPGQSVDTALLTAKMQAGSDSVKTMHVTMTMEGELAADVVGDVDRSNPDKPAVSLTLTQKSGEQSLDYILIDGVTYISDDGAKTWTKDASDTSVSGAIQQQDKYLEYLTKAVYTGEETVNGATARVFELTVELPSDASAELGGYKVWLDEHDRTVRYQMTSTVSDIKTVSDVTNSKFNEPVTITAPPSSQVTG